MHLPIERPLLLGCVGVMAQLTETRWFDLDIGPRRHGALLGVRAADEDTSEAKLIRVERAGNWCCGCCGCFETCCGTRQRSGVDGRFQAPGMNACGRMALVGGVLFLCAAVAMVLFAILVLSLDGFKVDAVSEQSSGSGDL